MSKKEHAIQVTTDEKVPNRAEQPRRISIEEACRMAFEASDKARQAQIAYAEEEAKRWSDYIVEE